jgi:hypothetical protein
MCCTRARCVRGTRRPADDLDLAGCHRLDPLSTPIAGRKFVIDSALLTRPEHADCILQCVHKRLCFFAAQFDLGVAGDAILGKIGGSDIEFRQIHIAINPPAFQVDAPIVYSRRDFDETFAVLDVIEFDSC